MSRISEYEKRLNPIRRMLLERNVATSIEGGLEFNNTILVTMKVSVMIPSISRLIRVNHFKLTIQLSDIQSDDSDIAITIPALFFGTHRLFELENEPDKLVNMIIGYACHINLKEI